MVGKKLLIVLLLILTFVAFIPFAHAAETTENFATDYHVTYTMSDDGTAHALLKITLTNLTSDYYASSYKIQLGFDNLVNIQASDAGGKIVPTVTKVDDGQLIALKFNKNVVGFNNKQVITISFDTPDISERQGKIWEINIPGIANESDFSSFDVTVQVPKSFGPAAYIKPAQKDKSLTFTKEQLGTSGISIAFGEKQAYNYTLKYHLQNRNLFPIRTEIALPPTTNYQDVAIDSLLPQPTTVHADQDGNWLAEYTLSPSQSIDVVAKGKVVIGLTPKKSPETDSQLKQYLEEKPYWQVSNTKIQQLAKELKTPEAIYAYVVDHLSYNYNDNIIDHPRYGATGILAHTDKAICLEFTDLFVALARAAGIPTREIDGYAYTQNPKQRPISLIADILHVWPEYYDREQQAWIMVDPTWGNTTGGVDYFHTLDFDHFVFVRKGISNTYPIPAGGYKTADNEYKKEVDVTFADSVDLAPADLGIDPAIGTNHTAGFPISGTVTVVNNGPTLSTQSVLTIASTLLPHDQQLPVGTLLPFQRKDVAVRFAKQPFLTNSTHTITMNLVTHQNGTLHTGKTEQMRVHVMPLFLEEWRLTGGIALAVLTFIILIIAIKAGRIHLS